jgi:tetratricopeptide (TPR) repeat protein
MREWRWPRGGKIKFSHLQFETTVYDWQGAQITLICFDELTHFSAHQFFYMVSRSRSTCGVRPYIRATCNPDADSWVADFLSWWIDPESGQPIPERAGVLRYFVRIAEKIVWADLRSGLVAYRATGAEAAVPRFIGLLAGACGIAGRIEEALVLLDDALQMVEKTGERWFEAELNRLKGQLLLRQGHTEAAEELYRKALSIAVEQEAKLWELRAAVSLARFRLDQGRHAEARDLLSPVYGWFTEGFDTPHLKDAKMLLDALNA